MKQQTVLIVDNNPYDCATFHDYLTSHTGERFRIREANSGKEALEYLLHETPDCAILDYHLPDISGMALLDAFKSARAELPFPVVMLTGDERATLAVNAMKQGVADYLSKDAITEQILLVAINNAIEKHLLQREVKAVYEALRISEKQYAGMVANVPGMIYRVLHSPADNVSKFLYVSEGSLTLFGLTPEQMIADTGILRRMAHPEEAQEYERVANLAIQQRQTWRWQGRFVLPSGEVKVIMGRGQPDLQPNGDLLWDGLMMDVTRNAQAEFNAAQLAAIVENSVDAIKSKTLEGIVTSWNKGAEKMYGYTAEEMIGQPITRVLPEERADEMDELLQRIRRGESVQSYESVRQAKDGTLLDVALTISPVKDREGKVVGAASIAQDIRPRKKADAQIMRQMQRLEALRAIDMAITTSLDVRLMLNVLLDQVTTHLNVDGAAVLLLDSGTQRLEYAAWRGFRAVGIQNTSVRIGEGYAGRAALEGRVIHIPNVKASRENLLPACLARENFVSYWAVPLVTKGRVAGVLEIFHRTPLDGDADWQNFLEALAGQGAIAIENAALFNDLQRSNMELQIAYDSTLEGWSKALDLRDKETEGHTLRVMEGTMTMAHAMNFTGEKLVQARRGALLHDIGKIGIPDHILLKPGPLTPEEWSVMKKHPVYAYELLSPIPFLRPSLDIPYCHHEKWDGSGYPRGLAGEQIPLSARLFAVVDVWDALRSDRPYRQAWPMEQVRDHIAAGSGSHFDPQVVEIFLDTNL